MHILAYIDPGTGTLILQALAATVLAVTMVFRNIRYAIYGFFCKITGKEPKDRSELLDEDDDEDDDEAESPAEK